MTAVGPPQTPTHEPAGTWNLGLFTCPTGMKPDPSVMEIHIADAHSLSRILPVFSAPISFGPRSHNKVSRTKVKKQDEIQRIYMVPSQNANSQEPATEVISNLTRHERTYQSVIITEKTSPDLDKVFGTLITRVCPDPVSPY
jgi:hypothetical protein